MGICRDSIRNEYEASQQTVYEYFLVFLACMCVEAGLCGVAGAMHCSEEGMDINHQEEHGSVLLPGDGWGVSAVMSP